MSFRYDVKSMFFDRQAVIDAIGRGNVKTLGRAGAFIQRRAKASIRKRKRASLPGEPPSSHIGTLRNLIYFGFDTGTRSVVVGPTPVGAIGRVPPTLEFGGPSVVKKNPRRRQRRIGGGGEIRLDGAHGKTTKRTRDGKWVTYTKLTTQAQADRANQLNEELYGPEYIGGKPIEARPYMGPSLRAETPNLPTLWASSIQA